ncbi:phosphoglycerol transferase MdoB-like AlkP superfamily enzyme [Natronospira proteinivora]|uniref:Phosphoglycerol transferase MdoB-like AlkP superfamily enzyme n=1 Tax=Natronospira proteinivora TaxID=1807133 RepID=A0ABT1GAH0_9GAMM|nr:hypothetical protein [Natronospira proteinivora]MCP1728324.1 phosphoglycerol transferase MdoB-like AlkP superfamily enzyme [Natronospira proteinivora]
MSTAFDFLANLGLSGLIIAAIIFLPLMYPLFKLINRCPSFRLPIAVVAGVLAAVLMLLFAPGDSVVISSIVAGIGITILLLMDSNSPNPPND